MMMMMKTKNQNVVNRTWLLARYEPNSPKHQPTQTTIHKTAIQSNTLGELTTHKKQQHRIKPNPPPKSIKHS